METELINKLMPILRKMGWSIAFEDNDKITGLVLGTKGFIKDYVNKSGQTLEVWSAPEEH